MLSEAKHHPSLFPLSSKTNKCPNVVIGVGRSISPSFYGLLKMQKMKQAKAHSIFCWGEIDDLLRNQFLGIDVTAYVQLQQINPF